MYSTVQMKKLSKLFLRKYMPSCKRAENTGKVSQYRSVVSCCDGRTSILLAYFLEEYISQLYQRDSRNNFLLHLLPCWEDLTIVYMIQKGIVENVLIVDRNLSDSTSVHLKGNSHCCNRKIMKRQYHKIIVNPIWGGGGGANLYIRQNCSNWELLVQTMFSGS